MYKNIKSLSGLNLPILTITDYLDLTIPIKERFFIVVTARIHPGESNGSWIMHVNFFI